MSSTVKKGALSTKGAAAVPKAGKVNKKAITKKAWTVMIYFAGDNNLSQDMVRAIAEMRAGIKAVGDQYFPTGQTDQNQVNFCVQFDGSHPYVPTKRYNLTYTNANHYLTTRRPVDVPKPTDPAPAAFQNPLMDTLKSFVIESIKANPADNFALILSGHSDAFLGRAFLVDEDPSGVMTLQEVAEILEEAKRWFPSGKTKLDLLGFDGCVMNTLEVLYEFRDVAETTIGSQGSIPNFTWDYAAIAKNLITKKSAALRKDYFIQVCRNSTKKYNRDFAFAGRSVDFSAIELDKVETPQNATNVLGFALAVLLLFHEVERPRPQIVSRLLDVLLRAHWNCQTSLFDQLVDLKDFAEKLKAESEKTIDDLSLPLGVPNPDPDKLYLRVSLEVIAHYAKKLSLSMDDGVVSQGTYVGAEYRYVNGLSFFYPWSVLGFYMAAGKYKDLEYAKKTPWHVLFLCLSTLLSARPKQLIELIPSNKQGQTETGIGDQLRNALDGISILPAIKSNRIITILERFVNKTGLRALTVDMVINWFSLQPSLNPPDSKLNPPDSKGLERYYRYFGSTNNIFPELNIEDDFPPNDGSPSVILDDIPKP